jgi:hypothetical protein
MVQKEKLLLIERYFYKRVKIITGVVGEENGANITITGIC